MSLFAIIGGGAVGVSALYQLVEYLLKVSLKEKTQIYPFHFKMRTMANVELENYR